MADENKVTEKSEEKKAAKTDKSAKPDKNKTKRSRTGASPDRTTTFDKEAWKPKTALGEKVKDGEITDIVQILNKGEKIMESEITDALLPSLVTELLLIGQSKGKFGGGQRRVFKQTQKKTQEGNKPKFATVAVIGNENGYIGIGYGKSKETVPAREKALRNAKLNIITIRRGCGSWQCGCKQPHTIPFSVSGKGGSVRLKLIPAPRGTGLKIETECQKILKIAGIKDIWSQTRGQTRSKINVINACFEALKCLISTKIIATAVSDLGIVEGQVNKEEKAKSTENE